MSYEAAKKRAEPYPKIVEELPTMRREVMQLVPQAVSAGRYVYVLVNNRSEENASLTVQALSDQLRASLQCACSHSRLIDQFAEWPV